MPDIKPVMLLYLIFAGKLLGLHGWNRFEVLAVIGPALSLRDRRFMAIDDVVS